MPYWTGAKDGLGVVGFGLNSRGALGCDPGDSKGRSHSGRLSSNYSGWVILITTLFQAWSDTIISDVSYTFPTSAMENFESQGTYLEKNKYILARIALAIYIGLEV